MLRVWVWVSIRKYAATDDWTVAKSLIIDDGDGLEGDPPGTGVEHAQGGEGKVKQLPLILCLGGNF